MDIIDNLIYLKHLKNVNIIFNNCLIIIGKEYEFNIEKDKKDIKELILNNNLPHIIISLSYFSIGRITYFKY